VVARTTGEVNVPAPDPFFLDRHVKPKRRRQRATTTIAVDFRLTFS
jgi:hypothetical protein